MRLCRVFIRRPLPNKFVIPQRMKSTKVIGTHSGSFHCDEALACFMLKRTDEFADADIIRSRGPTELAKCDILVDVGAVYEPATHRYDHHQAGFTTTFDDQHKIKLSSAGLVYKHFGRDIIARETGSSDAKVIDIIYQKIYDTFIEAIDGIDNGVNQYTSDIKPNYRVATDLSARVGRLNPAWNETGVDIDSRFRQGMQMAGQEFLQAVEYYTKAWLPARAIVEEAIKKRLEVDPSGEIIKLGQFCPWKDHLYNLEKELDIEGLIKYVLFQDSNGTWRVQCVGVSADGFDNRLSLAAPWRGLRDNQLSEVSGIPDCVFVHASGFIGGAKNYDGVMAMARKSLELGKQ